MTVKAVRIKVGIINLKENGTIYYVKKAILHENYYEPKFANDIALLRVQTPIKFNEKVRPINFTSDEVPENAALQAFGFGRLTVSSFFFFFASTMENLYHFLLKIMFKVENFIEKQYQFKTIASIANALNFQ